MKYQISKTEAIQKTLELIDRPPSEWGTFNDSLNTRIIDDKYEMRSSVQLNLNEDPILECILVDSFVLITTKRLISFYLNEYYEIALDRIIGLGNEFEVDNNKIIDGKRAKTNLITVKGENNEVMILKIDSFYPANFVKLLITNLSFYAKNGRWFWNPKQKW